jgi:hypothetical protein
MPEMRTALIVVASIVATAFVFVALMVVLASTTF